MTLLKRPKEIIELNNYVVRNAYKCYFGGIDDQVVCL